MISLPIHPQIPPSFPPSFPVPNNLTYYSPSLLPADLTHLHIVYEYSGFQDTTKIGGQKFLFDFAESSLPPQKCNFHIHNLSGSLEIILSFWNLRNTTLTLTESVLRVDDHTFKLLSPKFSTA